MSDAKAPAVRRFADGLTRCDWFSGDADLVRYHDEVWGTATHDESALFEALTLGIFEAGLSWRTVFRRRDGFARAFDGFDIGRVATMDEDDVARLLQDPGIIRNRRKIEATITNAKLLNAAPGRLGELAWACAVPQKAPASLDDIPTKTPAAEALAGQLHAHGFVMVGAVSIYAFLQNVGVVNDHLRGCFRAIPD